MPKFKLHYRLEGTDWADRNRFEEYREAVGRALMKLEIDPYRRDAADCQTEFICNAMPGLMMSHGSQNNLAYRRTPALIDNDDIMLSVTLAGQRTLSQLGRSIVLNAGEATSMTGAKSLQSLVPTSEQYIVFRLPRTDIAPLVSDLDAMIARTIPPNIESLRLLIHYASAIRTMNGLETPEAAHLASTHITDLIALAIGATRDGAELARARGMRAARLMALKRDIQEHLTRPDLSVSALAARHQISTSYIRKLFDGEGTSFTEFVLEQRLLRAHRMLRDPRSEKSVSAIAFECGFGDLSYFNRTFRRRYGLTPSEVRLLRGGD
jgi:AraC-like DNA-binding protein